MKQTPGPSAESSSPLHTCQRTMPCRGNSSCSVSQCTWQKVQVCSETVHWPGRWALRGLQLLIDITWRTDCPELLRAKLEEAKIQLCTSFEMSCLKLEEC